MNKIKNIVNAFESINETRLANEFLLAILIAETTADENRVIFDFSLTLEAKALIRIENIKRDVAHAGIIIL